MLAADVVYVDEWTTLFAKAAALLLQTPAEAHGAGPHDNNM